MGTALVTIKMMPESPQADLEAIQKKAKEIVEEKGGKTPSTTTEPVAFGLNAVILNFALDESKQILEKDVVEILSGIKSGETIGSPIALMVENKDFCIDELSSFVFSFRPSVFFPNSLKFSCRVKSFWHFDHLNFNIYIM